MKKLLSKASVLSFVVVLTFCDNNFFGTQLTRTSSLDPTSIDVTPRDTPPGGDSSLDYFDVDIVYEQPTEPGSVSPEIIFVMDRSGSMSGEAADLKNALPAWMDRLQDAGVENFCVDLLSASIGPNSGKLQAASGNAKCLCTSDGLTVAQIGQKFRDNLDAASSGESIEDDGGEAGFYSLDQAFNNPTKFEFNQTTSGCFRNDKTAAVIFLTDENEISASIDGTQTPSCAGQTVTIDGDVYNLDQVKFDNSLFESVNSDGQFTTATANATTYSPTDNEICGEVRGRLRYYSDLENPVAPNTYALKLSPQSIYDTVDTYNDTLPTYISGVVYQRGPGEFTQSGENGPGHGVFEVAAIAGQETVDLATSDDPDQTVFQNQMNQIADALIDAVTFIRTFVLVDADGDPLPVCPGEEDTLKVRVNGTLVQSSKYTLSANRKKVTFKPTYTGFTPGADVNFEYIGCQ